MINGTTILAGDVMIMCTLDGKPNVSDKVSIGGKTFNIVDVKELNPDGSCVIYYNLQVR